MTLNTEARVDAWRDQLGGGRRRDAQGEDQQGAGDLGGRRDRQPEHQQESQPPVHEPAPRGPAQHPRQAKRTAAGVRRRQQAECQTAETTASSSTWPRVIPRKLPNSRFS